MSDIRFSDFFVRWLIVLFFPKVMGEGGRIMLGGSKFYPFTSLCMLGVQSFTPFLKYPSYGSYLSVMGSVSPV